MLQPTGDVLAIRIMVCPMDDAAFLIPFILTIKGNSIGNPQCLDAGSDVYVMGDEQGLTRGKSEDEALMAAAVVVVG